MSSPRTLPKLNCLSINNEEVYASPSGSESGSSSDGSDWRYGGEGVPGLVKSHYTSIPKRSCLSQPPSSTPPSSLTTPLSSPPSTHLSLPLSRPPSHSSTSTSVASVKSVTFSPSAPQLCSTYLDAEYDRSPHPVVGRLSYRDVLELREMKVELGIVMRRQTTPSSSSNPGLCDGSSKLRATKQEEDQPLSPTSLSSPFPTSPNLLTHLSHLPSPLPPPAQPFMGLSVDPLVTLLSRTASSSSLRSRGRSGSASQRERGDSTSSDGSRRLGKKASAETVGEGESEFQREVRRAREEIEDLGVREMREREIAQRDRGKGKPPGGLSIGVPGIGFSITPERTSPLRACFGRSESETPTTRSAAFFSSGGTLLRPPTPTGRSSSENRVGRSVGGWLEPPSPVAPPGRGVGRVAPPGGLELPQQGMGVGKGGLHSPLPDRDPSPLPERSEEQGVRTPSPMDIPPPEQETPKPRASPASISIPPPSTSRYHGAAMPSPVLAPFARSSALVPTSADNISRGGRVVSGGWKSEGEGGGGRVVDWAQ